MGIGKTNAAGGGASLNFDVKAYATEEALLAAAPKENTIGVITENKITGWVFSAMEPAEPVEGMVWITTGTSSTIEFNALKKNAIQVYPISAKQYVGGAWASVDAMSYQGGEWADLVEYLLKNGAEYTDLTGGFTNSGYSYSNSTNSYAKTTPDVTDEGWVFSLSSATDADLYGTANIVDVSDYSRIGITVSNAANMDSGNDGLMLMTSKDKKIWDDDYISMISIIADGTYYLDISEVTECYIVLWLYGQTSLTKKTATVTKLWLE